MSSEIEGADHKTCRSEAVYNRGVAARVLADSMDERDGGARLPLGRPTPTEKGNTFYASKIEFRERRRLHVATEKGETVVSCFPGNDAYMPRTSLPERSSNLRQDHRNISAPQNSL